MSLGNLGKDSASRPDAIAPDDTITTSQLFLHKVLIWEAKSNSMSCEM